MFNIKKYYKISLLAFSLSMAPFGCKEEFLDRPPQDQYTLDNWYNTAQELDLAVNPLYGGVWFDYQRSYLNIGDAMAGNFHKGSGDPFYTFGVNNATGGLNDAYSSLWMAVAYANSAIENIRDKAKPTIAKVDRDRAMGEALVWKSMAYFFLVRCFGPVPIIESNSKLILSGEANSVYRNRREDVYEYIVRMLTRATELLPEANEPGRINKFSAYGLLSKVYLTRSGLTGGGSRSQDDLNKAREYAGMVVNSGMQLEPEYANLFSVSKGNRNPENLISWHWIAVPNMWGPQNAIQADLAVQQLSGTGDGWGTWSGPSIDLQRLYGEDATKPGAASRVNSDKRRKATMMMDGDHYPELKREKGGLTVTWDGGAVFASPTGANARKHIVGSQADHQAEAGAPMYQMKTSLSTHLLRLADVYLVYAEAILGNSPSTADAEALKAYNAVRRRSISGYQDATSFSFMDILNERRRELAYEGDNWFDYVRLSYYNPALAVQLLSKQERGTYNGSAANPPVVLNPQNFTPDLSDFTLPTPEIDVLKNPRLLEEPVPYDFSKMEQ